MTEKQEAIFGEVKRLKGELADLKEFAYERAPKIAAEEANKIADERDKAIQRAEKAEHELAEQKERARVGRLHAMETRNRLQTALKKIAHIEASRFPDTSTWRDLASEAINIARAAIAPKEGVGSDQANPLLSALEEYAKPENWSFYHTTEGYIRWVTKLGPDLAMEVLNDE